MVRDSLDEPFRRVSWDLEAVLTFVTQGPDALCTVAEDYVAQKLLKGCLGTNNFD